MQVSRIIFFASVGLIALLIAFALGYYIGATPNPIRHAIKTTLDDLKVVYDEVVGQGDAEILTSREFADVPKVFKAENARLSPGLMAIVGADAKDRWFIRVMDREGAVIQEWRPDWFEIWGDKGDFNESKRPKSRHPVIHGFQILPDGDVVFNFEHLSTIRMNPCGDIVWALQNHGHHSVDFADDETLWVSGEILNYPRPSKYYNHGPGYRAWSLQNFSLDGELIREIDVYDIFAANDLFGLLFMSSQRNQLTRVNGDTLHLNDVEAFPIDLDSEIFEPGDLLLSLRNINTVMVIDPETLKAKFLSIGAALRQHDPDFQAGDRITVFDNRNFEPSSDPAWTGSRVIAIDAATGEMETLADGLNEPRFYTNILGAHQILPDGGVLAVSSRQGRLLDLAPDGALRWAFRNRIDDGSSKLITDAELLPPDQNATFFEARVAACS